MREPLRPPLFCKPKPMDFEKNKMLHIFTSHVSRVDLLVLQITSAFRHIKCPFKFTVINDATNQANLVNFERVGVRDAISDICALAGVRELKFEPQWHMQRERFFVKPLKGNVDNANSRCSDVCQFALQNALLEREGDTALILDGDMMFVRDIDLLEEFKDVDLAFVQQVRPFTGPAKVVYPWNAFVLFKIVPEMAGLNFDYGQVNGHETDCGGASHEFLQGFTGRVRHLSDTCAAFAERNDIDQVSAQLVNANLKEAANAFNTLDCGVSSIGDFVFHYHRGGNWDMKEWSNACAKTKLVLQRFWNSVKPDNVFLDLGTHLFEGLQEFKETLHMDKTWHVLCFEPNPNVFSQAQTRLPDVQSQFASLSFVQEAVSNRDGTVTMNVHEGSTVGTQFVAEYDTGSNILPLNPATDGDVTFHRKSVEVPVRNIASVLDDVLTRFPLCNLWIKCDIEGSEFDMLPVLFNHKASACVRGLWVEWHERFWKNESKDAFNAKEAERHMLEDTAKALSISLFEHH